MTSYIQSPWTLSILFSGVLILSGCMKGVQESSLADKDESLRAPLVPQGDMLGSFDFCPVKKMLNTKNIAWMSYLSALEYSHFAVVATELEKLGFGHPKDGLFYKKIYLQLRIARLEAFQSTADDPWLIEPERQTKLKELQKVYADEYRSESFSRDIPDLEQQVIDTTDPNRGTFFISGLKKTPDNQVIKGSTQAVYSEHNKLDFAVIAFRGTEAQSKDDKAADLDTAHIPMANFGKAQVMRGFLKAYQEIDEQLMEFLKTRGSASKPIKLWVTGHSLGGAIATLFAAQMLEMKHEKLMPNVTLMGVYTFGSPRVGDNGFALRLDSLSMNYNVPLYRVRNYKDLVSAIPFGFKSNPGYWHAGSLVYIDRDGKVHYGNGWNDIEAQSDLLKSLPNSIGDHMVENYVGKLVHFMSTSTDQVVQNCSPVKEERGLAPYVENPELREIDWAKPTKNLTPDF